MKLVIHPPVDPERERHIVAAAESMRVVNAGSEEEALQAIAEADCFFGKLTPELLTAAQRLRWVQSPTASLEHYIFPELVEHPLVLTNMRGLYSDVIAEHVLGMMLCFTRNLHLYIRNQMQAKWDPVGGEQQRVTFATGPGVLNDMDRAHLSLGDLTAGVVGLGHIGGEIAERLASFGTRVLGVDPQATSAQGVEEVWPVERLDDLLAASDFVIIAAPHTPQTEGWFGRKQFQAMKQSAVLINIGRGAIVKLDDLTAALEAGEIAGAGLDVFEIEPLPPDHPLWKRENVILTPHVAGQSSRVPPRHLNVLLGNIGRFVRGEPLTNVVEKSRWF
ncbi:MAG: D-2-hydroxyacid dehydrogenase [Planctomycetota bacterium]|nr:MAG: D-2-hydroxyacid dehydrogenase [Planctomycetota bacterium]